MDVASLTKPVFDVQALDFLVRPNGRPLLLARGSVPSLDHLMDWRLLTWLESRDTLVFGGIHPAFMRPSSPFTAFFTVGGVSPTTAGLVEASLFCDFALIDADAVVTDNLIWTYVQRALVTRKAMLSGGMVG